MGLPGLDANQQLRVDLANAMYVESCKLFSHCVALGILVTLENPRRSLFLANSTFCAVIRTTSNPLQRLTDVYVGWTTSKMDAFSGVV